MTALLGTLAFLIPAGFFVRWAMKRKRKDIEKKRKAAKVIKFDVSEDFYTN